MVMILKIAVIVLVAAEAASTIYQIVLFRRMRRRFEEVKPRRLVCLNAKCPMRGCSIFCGLKTPLIREDGHCAYDFNKEVVIEDVE